VEYVQEMISVIIPTLNDGRKLPRCFDSLIGAAVGGVIREVIVADGGSSDDTLMIADGAGAHIVHAGKSQSARLQAGARAAKGDWLLFLYPDTALEQGWEAEVESFLGRAMPERPQAATFRFALEDFGGAARRAEFKAALRDWILALPYGDHGLLISRRFYNKLGGYRMLNRMEDAVIVRRIGRRRLVRLRAHAVNLGRPKRGVLRGAVLSLLHALRVPSRVVARL
jgi:glycosyltransferase involved in cell wall biosynthesis